MSHSPSLRTIYSRSSHVPPDDGDIKKLERKEFFIVSALAYCLQFDDEFRKHFANLCDPKLFRNGFSTTVNFRIQEGHCADLSIRDPTKKALIIVEAKIRGDKALDNHQDPRKKDFWEPSGRKRKKGYGRQINDLEDRADFNYVRYITLMLDKIPTSNPKYGISFGALEWMDLAPSSETYSAMWKDLALTLGDMITPGLLYYKMKKNENKGFLAGAVNMYITLQEFASNELGIKKIELDVSLQNDTYFGVNIPSAKRAPKFSSTPIKNPTGWFGYIEAEGNVLSVTAYCGSEDAARKMATIPPPINSRAMSVVDDTFTLTSIKDEPDCDWFKRAIDALFNKV